MNTPVPIPTRLQRLKLFNGIPVPFTTFWKDGIPDFKVTDHKAWATCLLQCRCGICGGSVIKDLWFIGGPLAIENGIFYDPPMHEECARYAFAVCPFIVGRKDYAKLSTDLAPNMRVDENQPPKRPDKMGLLRAALYVVADVGGKYYFHVPPEHKKNIEWLEAKPHA
jgi:hypothetical protein